MKKAITIIPFLIASLFLLALSIYISIDGDVMSGVFVFIFFIIFSSALFSMLIYGIRKNKFKKHGKKQFARYLETIKGNLVTHTVNDQVVSVTQYYCVKFQYRGSDGKIYEGKTSRDVSESDANKLQRAYYFEVYVMDNKAMLVNFPSEQEIERFSELKNIKFCSYCGSKSDIAETKCSSCGASDFQDIV